MMFVFLLFFMTIWRQQQFQSCEFRFDFRDVLSFLLCEYITNPYDAECGNKRDNKNILPKSNCAATIYAAGRRMRDLCVRK